MKKEKISIPYNYKTIKITKSRINKGLLSIPVSLVDYFPKQKGNIYVVTEMNDRVSVKHFTPYTSSSRECRIGGMRKFYEKYQIKDGDEIVVQIMDDNKYRILPEKQFENIVIKLEDEFDNSQSEDGAGLKLLEVSNFTGSKLNDTALNEYHRLSERRVEKREYNKVSLVRRKESVPVSLKKLLTGIYNGKCQITGFTFTMKNGKPYFEIHHIKSDFGNHIKNLLVVSPNIHAQFTYAFIEESFDHEGWLRQVKFNGESFAVRHIIDKIPGKFEKEVHAEI